MKALILAGGFATRLWPLSEKRTKPLLLVGGKPIVSHLVEKIPKDLEIIISTSEQFKEHFEKWKEKHFRDRKIKILAEPSKSEKDKKGAVGAMSYAISQHEIDDDLLILAGDNILDFDLGDFIKSFKGNSLVAVYDIGDREAAKKFGVVEIKDNKIVDFEEKPSEPKSSTVSTLCYILPKETLGVLKEFAKTGKDNAGDLIAHLVKETPHDIEPFVFSGFWFDVGSFEAYLEANKKLQTKPIISKEAEVKNSKIIGSSYICDGTVVLDSTIEDSVIMENCKIVNSVIRNCVIDDGCVIKDATLENQLIRGRTII